jgi:hypothetical protein
MPILKKNLIDDLLSLSKKKRKEKKILKLNKNNLK